MIDVLLATYRPNPNWLAAQLVSIQGQVGVKTNLLSREDVDGDGPAANFSQLLERSTAPYVAFCDQDDVWQPRKLERCLTQLQELEKRYGEKTPLLVFCDSILTDESLNPLPETLLARQEIDLSHGIELARLLMQNYIAGHTMLFNAALRELAKPIPREALMHDYWVALVAAAFGQIFFVNEPLVFYRQHGSNVLGIDHSSHGVQDFRNRLHRNIVQAQAFINRFEDTAPECVRVLASFTSRGWFSRRFAVMRYGLYKYGLARNLALFALI